MSRMGAREVYFVKAMNTRQIGFLVDEVKEVVKEMGLPVDYDVRVYKNVLSCCGIGGLGVVIEIVGPDEDGIKAIDLRAMSRILEFCEKEGLEVGHHSFGQFESL
jgi:hypothetical protein